NVRMVPATTLVEDNRILGHVESTAAKPVFYVDEDIGKIAAADYYVLSFVRTFAGRVLAHVDLRRFRRRAIKLHRTANCSHGCGIDRRCRWRGGRSFLRHCVARLLCVLLLVA